MPAVVSWTGAVDGNWSNASNWSGGVPTAGDELVFDSSNLAGNAVTSLSNDLTGLSVLSLDFGAGSFSIGGNALTVTSDVTVTGAGDDALGIAISGAAAVNMSGSANFTLSGNNGFTGAVDVNSGSLTVSANNALGTTDAGTTVDSGASLLFSSVTYTTEEQITLAGGTIGSTAGTSSFAGAIAMTTGTATFDVDGTLLTLSGDISGNFSISSTGTGILELSGDNTFLGDINVTAGTSMSPRGHCGFPAPRRWGKSPARPRSMPAPPSILPTSPMGFLKTSTSTAAGLAPRRARAALTASSP